MENKLVLTKREMWYNPMFIKDANSDKFYELSDIRIYDERGVMTSTRCGWFRDSDRHEINLNVIYHKRNKINFDRDECFIAHSDKKNCVDLYIPFSMLYDVKSEKDIEYAKDSDGNKLLRDKYEFTINGCNLLIYSNYKTVYTETNLNRQRIFKELGIEDKYEIKNVLKLLKENNINLNDII